MKKNKTLLSKLLFYTIIIVSNKNFAQVNFWRERDSINNSYQPPHLQNFDYKTKDYSGYSPGFQCGTIDQTDKSKFKKEEVSIPSFNTEIKVTEIQSLEPKKPTVTNTPN